MWPIRLVVTSMAFLYLSLTNAQQLIGAAKVDITGPVAGMGMQGYSRPQQMDHGLHMRMYARTFVVENSQTQKIVALVTADLNLVTNSLRRKVIHLLQQKHPDLFSEQNVLITATHTHSVPSGYTGHLVYDNVAKGFMLEYHLHIIQGIVRSIEEAYNNRRPGHIEFNSGLLLNASVNRSRKAFLHNPRSLQMPFETNKEMVLLKFVDDELHRPIGILDWFAVHTTSMSPHNFYISSDNKGVAAFRFEEWIKNKGPSTFVAAFANSEEGDASPNIFDTSVFDHRISDITKNNIVGDKQFTKAKDLFVGTQPFATQGQRLDYQHFWVHMPSAAFQLQEQDPIQHLCPSAFGLSVAAGADDGPSEIEGFYEGMTADHPINVRALRMLHRGLGPFLGTHSPALKKCQYPKGLLAAANSGTLQLTDNVFPFQMILLGELAILAVPAELTTMAGWELKNHLLPQLAKLGITHTVISGPANAYSHYVTTPQEYQMQEYEGASTLFGPNTLLAYQQIFSDLAHTLNAPLPRPPQGPLELLTRPSAPPAMAASQHLNFRLPFYFYNKKANEKYGTVLQSPQKNYHKGEAVQAHFRTTFPYFHATSSPISYLEVQRQDASGQWSTVATDDDPQTLYHWEEAPQDCWKCSRAVITWHTGKNTDSGTYRLLHRGERKLILRNNFVPFAGQTESFEVQN